jgi:hypothetical protein
LGMRVCSPKGKLASSPSHGRHAFQSISSCVGILILLADSIRNWDFSIQNAVLTAWFLI